MSAAHAHPPYAHRRSLNAHRWSKAQAGRAHLRLVVLSVGKRVVAQHGRLGDAPAVRCDSGRAASPKPCHDVRRVACAPSVALAATLLGQHLLPRPHGAVQAPPHWRHRKTGVPSSRELPAPSWQRVAAPPPRRAAGAWTSGRPRCALPGRAGRAILDRPRRRCQLLAWARPSSASGRWPCRAHGTRAERCVQSVRSVLSWETCLVALLLVHKEIFEPHFKQPTPRTLASGSHRHVSYQVGSSFELPVG